MASAETRRARVTFPIAYERKVRVNQGTGTRVAWALFLFVGVPFAVMTVLTFLARMGIYVDLFRPLWQPWPPDLLKPFLGLAVFAATLAYLTYRVGHRRGFRVGAGVNLLATRTWAEERLVPQGLATQSPPTQVPPPPPADEFEEL